MGPSRVLAVVLLFATACSDPVRPGQILPGDPPVIRSLTPALTYAGRGKLEVVVDVEGGDAGMTARTGTTELPSVEMGDGRLVVTLSPSLLAQVGTLPLTVRDPDGSESASAAFEVVPWSVTASTTESGSLAIASGAACGVTTDGLIKCWGSPERGRLGIGPHGVEQQLSPQPITGGGTGFVAVTGVDETFCGLEGSGVTRCWGGSFYGQAGVDGGTQDDASVPLPGGHRFERIALDASHGCGLEAGAAWCWGRHGIGATGVAAPGHTSVPVQVQAEATFQRIVVGEDVSCGLSEDGKAWCWGREDRLGIGSSARDWAGPRLVLGGHVFIALSAGQSVVCGLDPLGQLWCWGVDIFRLLTAGELPRRVEGLPPVTSVSVNGSTACALDPSDRSLWCWGSNGAGLLGRAGEGSSTPVRSQPGPWQSMDVGRSSVCGVRPTGGVECWGSRSGGGLLGDGRSVVAQGPMPVAGGRVYTDLSGYCGLSAGTPWCWGRRPVGHGQSVHYDAVPRAVGSSVELASISAFGNHSRVCGLTAGGGVYCSGGDESPESMTEVRAGLQATQLVTGGWHACALAMDGQAWCWGANGFGQIGELDGVTPGVLTPSIRFTQLAAGGSTTCGIDTAGDVHCVGDNQWGSLGVASSDDCVGLAAGECSRTPLRVDLPEAAVRLQASGAMTCAWTASGRRFCWGEVWASELICTLKGINFPCAFTPLETTGALAFDSFVQTRRGATCFIEPDLRTRCALNYEFAPNNGPPLDEPPERFDGLGPRAVTLGDASCALSSGGQIFCEGTSYLGELGNGVLGTELDPVTVLELTAPIG
jgi:alpha-tubulin suppressor-like RCC1 family protein